MNLQAVYHQPKSNYCYAYNETAIHIRIRTARGDSIKVVLVYGDKFEWNKHGEMILEYECNDGFFNYYTVEIPYMPRLAYYFKMINGLEVVCYTQWGIVKEFDEEQSYYYYFQYPYVHKSGIHKVPEWVKDSIFYEIFPDRFYNGNRDNDPEKVEAWGKRPCTDSFFGGDLCGVIEKIEYLKDLGINAIYMTPIFKSISNHKYDTVDYFYVDSHFGDLETLKKLVAVCHENGIRVILDGVFNHCSCLLKQFRHVLENGSESPYFKWFYFNGISEDTLPFHYETFSTVSSMPKLNTENKEVRDYLLSAVRYWMEQTDIDGWRLDVADELSPEFLRELRECVKQWKDDAYIVGESWYNASPWLMGDQLDAVMNYQLTTVCLDYFALNKINSKDFIHRINKVRMDYTRQVNEVMFNILESHDTKRFLTLCGGDIRILMIAVTFQLSYTGVPCVYYGTEIGMEGGDDPDCRRTFIWDKNKWSIEFYQYIRKLIHLRRNYEVLRRGCFTWIENEGDIIAYERRLENQKVIILINKYKERAEVRINAGKCVLKDLLSNQIYNFGSKLYGDIMIPGLSAKILLV